MRMLNCLVFLLLLFHGSGFADTGAADTVSSEWILDNDASTLSFTSIKAGTVAESHTFGKLVGGIGADGSASLMIDLDSVDTGIEIRDQRMRELLFDTSTYAVAGISLTVPAGVLDTLEPGEQRSATVEATLELHGMTRPVTAQVAVARLGEDRLLVTSERPLLLNAADVGLADGVERLREVAGLPSISPAVPVSFVLLFESAQPARPVRAARRR
jgi:polyisoprenoid-binding protein YceI